MSKHLQGMPLYFSMFALAIATFMIVLDYSIANVSIPYIAGDLAVSNDQGTYVITSFAVGNAIVLPITGWLTKRIGAVKLILVSILLFVLLSWLCGATSSFDFLVIFRFLQGAAAGPLIPLSQSLLISINPPEKTNKAIAIWGAIIIAAPVIGPVLGGWISYDYTWPWIFYINIPIGILSALLIYHYLTPFETEKKKEPVDYIGLTFLTLGVTSLQIFLDKGQDWDWFRSPYIVALSITSVLSFTYLIVWEYFHKYPIISLKLFKTKSFSASVIFIGVSYSIYFGTVVLIPLWLQEFMGYTPIWAGIAVAPIGMAPLLFSIFSGWFVTKFGKILPLFLCFILLSLSCFYTAYFTTDVDIFHVMVSRFLLGVGLIFFITPLNTLVIQDIPEENYPSATGVFHFVRALFGGIGTSVFTTLWDRRTTYYHEREGSVLTSFSQNTKDYLSNLESLQIKGKKALAMLNHSLDKQAAMLSLNDCFYLMGWILLFLIIFLPLGRKRSKQA